MSNNPGEKLKDKDQPESLSAGKRLKQAREERGLSLETIHDATKIPIDALRAIEEGYNVRTLSPFYYKGFIKIYSQYLHIDVSETPAMQKKTVPEKSLEQEYRQFFLRDWLTTTFTVRRLQQAMVIVFGCLVLFTLFKAIQFVFSRPSVRKPQKIEKTAVPAPALKAATNEPSAAAPQIKVVAKPKPVPKPAEPPKPVAAPKPVEATKPVTPKPAVTSQPAVKQMPPAAPRAAKNVTLVVRARQDSWLRVKQDGSVVFQSTLLMGSVETWLADEKIEITGKNISQLEFELNGKMIGALGRKDRDAKTLIFTKDGMQAGM